MLSCEAIPDAVPGLIPSGRPDIRPVLPDTRNAQPALGIAGFPSPTCPPAPEYGRTWSLGGAGAR